MNNLEELANLMNGGEIEKALNEKREREEQHIKQIMKDAKWRMNVLSDQHLSLTNEYCLDVTSPKFEVNPFQQALIRASKNIQVDEKTKTHFKSTSSKSQRKIKKAKRKMARKSRK